MNRKARITLDISDDEYILYYQGAVKWVIALTHAGSTIRFPASVLKRFVSHTGIHGVFEISYDKNHKFQDIKRIG